MTPAEISEEFRAPHFVELGQARVCYRRAGSGPALVLLHGFPLSGLTWRKLVPELAQRFTCWALDLVGLGETTSSQAADFSSPGQAQLFQRALAELGVSSYALVGNDTGGWIARELALLDTARVTHLALTNTEIPDHRPPWIPLYQSLAGLPGSPVLFKVMLRSRTLLRSGMGLGGCFDNLDLIDGEFSALFLDPLRRAPQRLAALFTFLQHMKFTRLDAFCALHRQLTMPVGLIWGAADPTFPEPLARAMTSQFPKVVNFWSIPRGKLFIQEEFADAVTPPLLELLTGRA